jgi:hypothetical protein
MTDDTAGLATFLDDAFDAQERISSADLQRRAIAADLPATLLTRIDALPEGEYAQDEATEALTTPPLAAGAGPSREPLADPGDDADADFADEHARTIVGAGEGETESPGAWTGGLDREGPP